MDEADQTTSDPAQPILASSLLDLEERQRRRFAGKGERVSTGCTAVDESVLGGGGLERGIVVGISSENLEGRLLSLNLIASILLGRVSTSRNSPKVAIIDTSSSFPISLLAKVIKARIIQANRGPGSRHFKTEKVAPAKYGQIDDNDVEEEVQEHLEKVTISRVFDIEGLWEVLGEVTRNSRPRPDHQDGGEVDARDDEESPTMKEIADSQDESLSPVRDSKAVPEQPGEQGDEGIEILVVDSMTDIINGSLANKERTEAHNMLATLSTIIHNLSSQSNILTVLHNSTVSSKSPYSTNPDTLSSSHQLQNPSVFLSSVFTSNPLKPALGRVFDQFPSLHIMLSSMPKARQDAEVLFGQNKDGPDRSHVEYCVILEVLKDETPNLGSGRSTGRFGQREQRWVPLAASDDGLSLVPAFLDRENRAS